MCVSFPGRIVEITDPIHRLGQVELDGQMKSVNLGMLTPEEATPGNWVLVQAGLAIQTITSEEAQSVLDMLAELDRLFEEEET